ncbi:MAG: hypothetical protein M3N18_08260 [Actinomycetota bacterium]|nr:hypothetical protein [Actinomycetota bacterium]
MNRAAAEALGFPEAVEFLFSEEERVIGIRAAEPGSASSYRLKHQGSGRGSYQITSESFVKRCGIPHERATRYEMEVDGGMLLVRLKAGGVDVSPRPGPERGGE